MQPGEKAMRHWGRSSIVGKLVLVGAAGVLLMPVAARHLGASDHLPRSLLAAFREVVREPARSTAQVYCDGYRVCLGTVVRSDGYIATKASELKQGKLECQLFGQSHKHPAQVVARDPATDLAILKIAAEGLPLPHWAQGDSPAIGSWLASVGLSQDPISVGVVSAPTRKISPPPAALGVQLDQNEDVARIAAVMPGLAADRAGLKEGDVILQVDGVETKGRQNLQQAIRAHQPGDKVTLVIEREGRQQTLEVTLGSMHDFIRDERAEFQNSLGGALSERRTGFPLAIQHDSVLKPSECGGPVVDLDGNVVGLNIARAGRVETYALPASLVRQTVDRLLDTALTSAPAESKSSPAPPHP
jgi:serine protease Do